MFQDKNFDNVFNKFAKYKKFGKNFTSDFWQHAFFTKYHEIFPKLQNLSKIFRSMV
jgi:hypothetical protein